MFCVLTFPSLGLNSANESIRSLRRERVCPISWLSALILIFHSATKQLHKNTNVDKVFCSNISQLISVLLTFFSPSIWPIFFYCRTQFPKSLLFPIAFYDLNELNQAIFLISFTTNISALFFLFLKFQLSSICLQHWIFILLFWGGKYTSLIKVSSLECC